MKFSVDPWDPSYGSALDEVLEPTEVVVETDVEVVAAQWEPITVSDPVRNRASVVLFVDGVRRIDAQVWIEDDWTDLVIADRLIAAGVLPEDLRLGFQPPQKSKVSELAVA